MAASKIVNGFNLHNLYGKLIVTDKVRKDNEEGYLASKGRNSHNLRHL